ncbi:polynucleotide kinase 3 phosphatase-domain-containing protein [Naematelia encephala]|uniref:Polynucleotide kinase 3 phosphatase-domain-containing protein n=1 Tax=Naematelia encephala TaxID=71784 RepID=A0A1Y2B956_9TREE|nr:polynucleotide kinase 3 phosphatase-domain-containing protein [Naematelia encephala]
MSGVKRPLATSPTGPSKKPHPFFSGPPKSVGKFLPSHPNLVHFLHLDPFAASSSSTLTSSKIPIIFYDLDGTLIKTKSKARFPKNREDWIWWHDTIPKRLKAEHDQGKHLVVISNQGVPHEKTKAEWRAKVSLIAAKMPADVPLRILAALSKDVYRKPNIGMYETVEAVYRSQGFEIDLKNSVFVGDAAGRLASKSQMQDHGNSDYKFAINVGIRFLTPEEHFLGQPRPPYPIPPTGFRPSKLANLATRASERNKSSAHDTGQYHTLSLRILRSLVIH